MEVLVELRVMKRLIFFAVFSAVFSAWAETPFWQDAPERSISTPSKPSAYRTVRLQVPVLRELLSRAPREFTEAGRTAPVEMTLPLPDGTFARFRVVESPMLTEETAREFPTIRNYSGQGIDDPSASMRCDLTVNGFHAIILSSAGDVFIEPAALGETEHYISYFTRDDPRTRQDRCAAGSDSAAAWVARGGLPQAFHQAELRTYFLAAAATGEFTQQFVIPGGDNSSAALQQRAAADINTAVMGVNAIYNRDLAIRMTLLVRSDLIFTDPATDGYTSGNQASLNAENQTKMDTVVGDANYDIGHVFDIGNAGGGGSGLAALGTVCRTGEKAKGTTGGRGNFVLAAHEMGHSFGASHTFNANNFGACFSLGGAPQRNAATAYEPASGSSIMSYGSTCSDAGGTADLQQSRDLFFNESSLEQIISYTTGGAGAACAVVTNNGNNGIEMSTTDVLYVPVETPFQLTVFARDIDTGPGNNVTVSWEEYDLGPPSPPNTDDGQRPIFRVYQPTAARTRTFPALTYILNNANDPPEFYNCGTAPAPVNCVTGEALPRVQRTGDDAMVFHCVARDNDTRGGSINSVVSRVHIIQTNMGGFRVNATGDWTQGSRRLVNWQTVGTANPPFNVANVRILLSTDGGLTFPTVLVASTPNDGSESVFLPEVTPLTSAARLKVEAIIPGFHSFFDISDQNFNIVPLAVSNSADSGPGSLREAILEANSDPGLSTIRFDVHEGFGVETINLTTELPLITSPVIIDGWSQGGAGYSGPPLIELSGVNVSPGFVNNGLTISGGGSTVQGLIINRFSGSGIDIRSNGGNKILGCYIGVNANATQVRANSLSGILINNTANNEIGRRIAGAENVISGNNIGIRIMGPTATGNEVRNNYIGTNSAGTDLGNTFDGVRIEGAPQNLIGGTRTDGGLTLPTGNVISGNGANGGSSDGIEISGAGAAGNRIEANLIGLNTAGTAALGNLGNGILIDNAPNTVVGGGSAQRNFIAGNQSSSAGIFLTGSGASGTVISGNYLGTNFAGTAAIPNNATNITVQSANNQITGNLISGSFIGIYLSFGGATGNSITANYIGTNAAGTAALNSTGTGIEMRLTSGNTIGGPQAGMGNLISGNTTALAVISSTSTAIEGNLIGTNPAGTAAVPNTRGIFIDGGSNNRVGGLLPGARNVISGNGTGGNDHGIILSATSGNTVQGNYIGTNAAGTAALGNGGSGIAFGGISSSTNNLVGGASVAARNIISANRGNGIFLNGNSNIVQGNFIGTDVNGTVNLGNGQPTGAAGIEISGSGNTIGGLNAGEGNIIAYNGCAGCFGVNTGSGLRIFGTTNRIRGNSIHSNVELGLDLNGGGEGANRVTPNDNCDGDSGPNNLQNFPVLTSASSNGINTVVNGTLNSTASTAYQIDFYASSSCDPSGNGEGQFYLGSATANTDGTCAANIQVTLPVNLSAGSAVTATATDPAGNTSEFSACVTVPSAPDQDGDGLPDDFEQFYFGSPTTGDPNADNDGDGQSNLSEYLAGTNPTSAASVLRIVSATRDGSGFTLAFSSVAGKKYRIEYRDSLAAGSIWQTLQTNISGNGGIVSIVDPGAPSTRFYRVLVIP